MKIELFTMRYYHEIIDLWKRSGIEVSSSDTRDEIAKMLKRNPDLFLIGKENEKVIAVVMGAFDGRRGYVHHLAIDPDYQKKKYGKMMMDELIEKFHIKKVHKVIGKAQSGAPHEVLLVVDATMGQNAPNRPRQSQ